MKTRFSDGKTNAGSNRTLNAECKKQLQKRETTPRIKYGRGQQRPPHPKNAFWKKTHRHCVGDLRLIFSRANNAVCGVDLNPEEWIATGCGILQTPGFKMPAQALDVNKIICIKINF